MTSGGLLVGVIVTSIVNLLGGRSNRKGLAAQTELQLEGQRKQLELQAATEHKKWRREVRRDAYVAFLVCVEQVRNLIGPLADAFPGEPYSATSGELMVLGSLRTDLQAKYDAAFQQGQVVRLEGPTVVGSAAQDLLKTMAYLLNAASERFRAAEASREPEHRLWSDAAHEMHEALERFLNEASTLMDLQ